MIAELVVSLMAMCEPGYSVPPHLMPIVEDAKRRWVEHVGGDEGELEPYEPIVLYMFGERCVHFALKFEVYGGSPTYCYKADEDVLVRADEISEIIIGP